MGELPGTTIRAVLLNYRSQVRLLKIQTKIKEKMKKIICSLVQLVAGMALFFCFALSTSAVINMVALAVVCGVCFGAQWVQEHVHVSID